jgi:glycine betaine/choline ABC-type transport system substrate-binding protein
MALLALTLIVSGCSTTTGGNDGSTEDTVIRVGSKDFTENLIVSEIYALALEDAGYEVERIPNIASSVVHTSITNDEIDLYPEYTGTGLLVVLEMESNQYSFSEISKILETNDAQITQLNTSNDAETGLMQVTLRINKPEVSDIVATFQRYEYNVKYFFGEEQYGNELRTNYDNLMNYLKI